MEARPRPVHGSGRGRSDRPCWRRTSRTSNGERGERGRRLERRRRLFREGKVDIHKQNGGRRGRRSYSLAILAHKLPRAAFVGGNNVASELPAAVSSRRRLCVVVIEGETLELPTTGSRSLLKAASSLVVAVSSVLAPSDSSPSSSSFCCCCLSRCRGSCGPIACFFFPLALGGLSRPDGGGSCGPMPPSASPPLVGRIDGPCGPRGPTVRVAPLLLFCLATAAAASRRSFSP